jgi:hypothetical protein
MMIVYDPCVSEEPAAEASEPADSDHAYFQSIEELFVRLRGAPLLLSPADWQVAARWHREGVPLALVQRVVEEVFARRAARGAKGRIQSLRYCREPVEAAWAEIQSLTGPGRRLEAEPLDLPPRLAALSAALPEGLPGREELAGRIRALAGPGGDAHPLDSESVEAALATFDRRLLDQAAAALAEDARAALEGELEATLGSLAARLPAEELEAARDRLRRQLLRRRLRLPVLSLFSPEAEIAAR